MRSLFISFIFLLLILSSFSVAYAQEIPISLEPTVTPVPTPIEYTLPYPGLLPDNPLYTLKVMRDRIILFLISDTGKKAEFSLLQADKRLNTGMYLFKKDPAKEDLTFSTVSKGENYFEEAIQHTSSAKKQGKDVKPLTERLSLSVQKHRVSIVVLHDTSSQYKEGYSMLLKRLESFKKQIESLK